jgi:hypothetical protein
MATQQVWRKNKEGKLVKVESGNAIEGDWYEQYDEDGNRVKGEYARGFVRAPQNNGSQPHSGQNVAIDQKIGGEGVRRRTPAARAREGRRIREAEERAAARRAGRQDKYEEALEYYERNKDKVGARPPSISQSDSDLDAYIRRHKPTAPKESPEATAGQTRRTDDRSNERVEQPEARPTKPQGKSKPFAERQKENVASVRSELKSGESIETKIKKPVSTDPRIKTRDRPAARFDYGDGKKVALKDPLKEYRGKDGIVRDTPEDQSADLTAKIKRDNTSEAVRVASALRQHRQEQNERSRQDAAQWKTRIALREVDAARRKPGYNPTRQQIESINAARKSNDAYRRAKPGDAGNIYKPTENERLRQEQERRGHPSTVVSPENSAAMPKHMTAAQRLRDEGRNEAPFYKLEHGLRNPETRFPDMRTPGREVTSKISSARLNMLREIDEDKHVGKPDIFNRENMRFHGSRIKREAAKREAAKANKT